MQSNHRNTQSIQPKDCRVAHRYRFYVDIEIDWGSQVLRGRVRDISRTGMFIETVDCLWINACFMGRLALDAPLLVECVVRRIEPHQGIGVTIAVLDMDAKPRFDALLRALQNEADPAAAVTSFPHVDAMPGE
jgi:hypothetical protein